jgi:hypothetical protein
MNLNPEILTAALEGLQAQRDRLQQQIDEVRRLMGARPGRRSSSAAAADGQESPAAGGKATRKRRKLSAEARQRMAEAQKRRWAAVRSAKAGKGK